MYESLLLIIPLTIICGIFAQQLCLLAVLIVVSVKLGHLVVDVAPASFREHGIGQVLRLVDAEVVMHAVLAISVSWVDDFERGAAVGGECGPVFFVGEG